MTVSSEYQRFECTSQVLASLKTDGPLYLLQVLKAAEEADAIPSSLRAQAIALANLELALVDQLYSNPDAAKHLASAQEAVGLRAELTGQL